MNGLSGDEGLVFNGMGCLAAAMVAHFKTEPGGIYLYPPGSRDCGEEYIYKVFKNDGKIWLSVLSGCTTFFGLPGTKESNMPCIYSGPVADYDGEAVDKTERAEEPPPNDYIESKTA